MSANKTSSFKNYLSRRMATNTAVSTLSPTAADSIFPMMSPSKSKSSNLQQVSADDLVRRLQNLQMIIEKFFILPGTSDILERKISQLETMIAEFPVEAEKMADHWRDKVVNLWRRLSTVENEQTFEQADNSIWMSPSSSFRPVNKVDFQWKSLPTTSPNANNSTKQLGRGNLSALNAASIKSKLKVEEPQSVLAASVGNQTPAKSNSAATATATATTTSIAPVDELLQFPQLRDQFTIQNEENLQKQALRASLEKTFSELSDIDSGYGENMDSVKRLLAAVAKADRELAKYSNDAQLQFDIFSCAFRKLTDIMREQFFAIYGVRQNGINLKNLISFLQAEIVAQHSKTVWLLTMMPKPNKQKSGENGQVTSVTGSKAISSTSTSRKSLIGPVAPKWPASQGQMSADNHCNYCKAFGHKAADCPCIKQLLCFQCYNYGHTKKGCPNEPMI